MSGSRTTRLTVIDDTPASFATADRVGAEWGCSGSAVVISVSLANAGQKCTIRLELGK
jgi:hypothetical protein